MHHGTKLLYESISATILYNCSGEYLKLSDKNLDSDTNLGEKITLSIFFLSVF